MNFIVLGLLVEKVSGVRLNEFARAYLFQPDGDARKTYFGAEGPSTSFDRSMAPTEKRTTIGCVARSSILALTPSEDPGHAGLFSTADDLITYCQMILHDGELPGESPDPKHNALAVPRQVMKPETVKLMTTPRPVPGGQRTLGWDVDTSYSRNGGSLFPRGKSFGHTGFTGTSIGSILLENRSRVPEQSCSSGWQRKCHPSPRASRDHCRGGGGIQNSRPHPPAPSPHRERGSKIQLPPLPFWERGAGGVRGTMSSPVSTFWKKKTSPASRANTLA